MFPTCIRFDGNRYFLLYFVYISLLLSGCASYSYSFSQVEQHIAAQQPTQALEAHENLSYANKDRVLYLLNKAILQRMNGDYAASNMAFEQAKTLIEERSTTSITEQTSAFLINDATRSYVGEPFEQVLIHLYKALNYLELGDLDAARVEALQVDLQLREFAQNDEDTVYNENAFARYLSGIIYEDQGEWSDAMIAYRKAYQAYKNHSNQPNLDLPIFLQKDLLRLAEQQGLTDELEKFKNEFSVNSWQDLASLQQQGELIFIYHNGLAPIKREHSQLHPNPHSRRLIAISLPYYETRPTVVTMARIYLDDVHTDTVRVENINAIAVASLKSHMPAIIARSIARLILKQNLAKKTGEDNPLVGFIVNIAGVITERADTRSWLTLPGEIHLARKAMPPGTYTTRVELLDAVGNILLSTAPKDITLVAGKKTYFSYHWAPAYVKSTRH